MPLGISRSVAFYRNVPALLFSRTVSLRETGRCEYLSYTLLNTKWYKIDAMFITINLLGERDGSVRFNVFILRMKFSTKLLNVYAKMPVSIIDQLSSSTHRRR